MAADLLVYTLISIEEAEPLWPAATVEKTRADAESNGLQVSGVYWLDGVTSVVHWPARWPKPGLPNLQTAYFWGTLGRTSKGE